jgi:hypothetical protein
VSTRIARSTGTQVWHRAQRTSSPGDFSAGVEIDRVDRDPSAAFLIIRTKAIAPFICFRYLTAVTASRISATANMNAISFIT